MTNIEQSIVLKRSLDALRPLQKDDEMRIMQKFRLDWNYHSNNLEGNSLTYGETKALILFGITAQGKPLKDHFEITGHNEAIKWIMEVVHEDRPITENFIRELHKLILKESYEVDARTPDGKFTKKKVNIGQYKSTPNHVETKTGEIFRFATPEETPALMHDLVNWYKNKREEEDVNPILLAAEFHYRYIRIHPFDDGNGRTARILMNFILMQFGYPPVIIKTEDKLNYFAVLRLADAGQLNPFIEYIAENLNRSLEIMIKGAKGESIEEPDDFEKELVLLEQRLKTVDSNVQVEKKLKFILQLFESSIKTLFERFINRSSLFDRFYSNTVVYLYCNKINKPTKIIYSLEEARKIISIDINELAVNITYRKFNIGLESFDKSVSLHFEFKNNSYEVFNNAKVFYTKLYTEQLSQKEMSHLIDTEMQGHKAFIEQKMEEMKK